MWGVQLLPVQEPVNRSGWWKGKFALFQMQATGGEGCGHPSKANSPPTPTPWQAGSESIYRQSQGRGQHAETAQSSLTVIFKLVTGGLPSSVLVALGTVNLQFRGALVPISLQSVLRTVAAHVLVWSGHRVVNFTWCFSIYKTAHRIWLRVLSIALEKELKVLDYA